MGSPQPAQISYGSVCFVQSAYDCLDQIQLVQQINGIFKFGIVSLGSVTKYVLYVDIYVLGHCVPVFKSLGLEMNPRMRMEPHFWINQDWPNGNVHKGLHM